jgi:hypothetical protein
MASAAGTNWLWGSLTNRVGADAKDYVSLDSLTPHVSKIDFLEVDYSPEAFGKHAYVRYGDPDASEREIERGDGHHVGTIAQIINRFLISLAYIQSRFYERDLGFREEKGEVVDLIQEKSIYSEVLGEDRSFGIVFPPGYNNPENAEKRYPVVYFLHGQGTESDRLLGSAILFFGYQAESTRMEKVRRRESEWAKFIMVFPNSTCSQDACSSGNFNTNHTGLDGNGLRYADSIFELMAHVEETYRVARPFVVPRSDP